jgi:hypothetical protein
VKKLLNTSFESFHQKNVSFADEIPSKKPMQVEDMVVKDENGRRRFHGAFTGGFSAGYWNTVGSKDGKNLNHNYVLGSHAKISPQASHHPNSRAREAKRCH